MTGIFSNIRVKATATKYLFKYRSKTESQLFDLAESLRVKYNISNEHFIELCVIILLAESSELRKEDNVKND